MSDTPKPAQGIGTNRAARAAMRQQLRRDLIEGRATLRSERDAAAAAASHRAPRWRPARHTGGGPINRPEATEPDAAPIDSGLAELDRSTEIDQATQAAPPDVAPAEAASVFSAMMGDIVDRDGTLQNGAPPAFSRASQPDPGAGPGPDLSATPLAEPMGVAAPAAAAVLALGHDGPIGTVTALGPGMLARLRLLGYAQITDLAGADAAELRAALGDISRLLNVEGWIAEARRAVAGRPA